ncbi:MAG: hypothetical protein KDD36_13445 [Flavobacteriales bacterium]|nr:hypothetical protein [Flavobacteriales bacterium]
MKSPIHFAAVITGLFVSLSFSSYSQVTTSSNNYPSTSYVGSSSTSTLKDIIFKANGLERMRLQSSNGFVGIGVNNPTEMLHVNGNIRVHNAALYLRGGTDVYHGIAFKYDFGTKYIDGPVVFGYAGGALATMFNGTEKVVLKWENNGKVMIGNVGNPGDYRLYVEKGILTEKVKVAVSTTSDWADYVFAADYKMKSIEELDAYVKEHQHLPNVPSAKDVVSEGIDLAKMDATLLSKIEELSLYIIQLKKENTELAKRIEKMENE